MTTQYIVNIDWPALHAAFSALDHARVSPASRIGYTGVYDALGGSYFAKHYEDRGVAGAVELLGALELITEEAWKIIHTAAGQSRGDAEIRSAVAVMLAARPAYDLLATVGLCEPQAQSITRGNDGLHLHTTGLHWLAGIRTDRRVTVEQARAIASGAPYNEVLSERDEAHPDVNF